MRIAIVGAGISGLTAAYRLSGDHEVTLYEERERLGGHTHTIDLSSEEGKLSVDTGFIVYNERNYPRFCPLLDEWEVPTQASTMSFGIRHDGANLEYAGSSLGGLFAQSRNLVRPAHYKFLLEILRFGKLSKAELAKISEPCNRTLGEFLDAHDFSAAFRLRYLLPMASAIWSSPHSGIEAFPLATFFRFFENHGLLDLRNRPQWRVIAGGSKRYIEALLAKVDFPIHTSCPVRRVRRTADTVELALANGEVKHYDALVLACHSDQALAVLDDAVPEEREILGALPYTNNSVVLHTDESVLPRSKRAWAAWNYWSTGNDDMQALPAVTYSMNTLQELNTRAHYLVTLNRDVDIDPKKVIRRFTYAHPQFSLAAIHAQQRRAEISGANRIVYCGAYWGYGFHEDGVRSAEDAVAEINRLAQRTQQVAV